jgi:hypothetical protein
MVEAPLYVLRPPRSESGDRMRPWVARILGPCARYGLEREFVRPLADLSEADRDRRGRLRRVVATFPLRAGWVVDCWHKDTRGRHWVRYFARVTEAGLVEMTQEEVTAWAETQHPHYR